MGRRNCPWTEDDEALWNAVYEITAEREDGIQRIMGKTKSTGRLQVDRCRLQLATTNNTNKMNKMN